MVRQSTQPDVEIPINESATTEAQETYPRLLKRARTWLAPDVWLVKEHGQVCVAKDFSARPLLIRLLWCRHAMQREVAAYRRLEAVPAVPHLVAVTGPDRFLFGYIEGPTLPGRRRDLPPLDFFDALLALVRTMHSAGVAHGDIRRRNIVVQPDLQPGLIDFETAVVSSGSIFRRFVFRQTCRVDVITALKLKKIATKGRISADEEALLALTPWWLRAGRFFRRSIYKPISPKNIARLLRGARKARKPHKPKKAHKRGL